MVETRPKLENVKLTVLGNMGVGKSSLIAVFSAIVNNSQKKFDEIVNMLGPTVGCDFISARLSISKGFKVKVNVWDTAGHEKYRSMNRSLYLGAHGVLLCFDLTDKLRVEDIDQWKDQVRENAGQGCSILIVGTKNDGNIVPETRTTLIQYANNNHFNFIETSALLGTNVKEAFIKIVDEIEKNYKITSLEEGEDEAPRRSMSLSADKFQDNNAPIKVGCCG